MIYEELAQEYLYILGCKNYTLRKFALLVPIDRDHISVFNNLNVIVSFYPTDKRPMGETIFDAIENQQEGEWHGSLTVQKKIVETTRLDGSVDIRQELQSFKFKEGDYFGVVFDNGKILHGIISSSMVEKHWVHMPKEHLRRSDFYEQLLSTEF